jgi:soluble lytic murein transglycosylase-like protein
VGKGAVTRVSAARAVRRAVSALVVFAAVGAASWAGAQPQARTRGKDEIGPPYQRLIEKVARRHDLDPFLFTALVEVESARQAGAVSPKGARGLGQLMPATARRFGVQDVHNPEENLEGAAKYLSSLIKRYEGDIPLALAAYNAGEKAVERYGGVPNYRETKRYVANVLDRAGLPNRTRQLKPGEPEPVRIVRQANGKILFTNTYK